MFSCTCVQWLRTAFIAPSEQRASSDWSRDAPCQRKLTLASLSITSGTVHKFLAYVKISAQYRNSSSQQSLYWRVSPSWCQTEPPLVGVKYTTLQRTYKWTPVTRSASHLLLSLEESFKQVSRTLRCFKMILYLGFISRSLFLIKLFHSVCVLDKSTDAKPYIKVTDQ